MLLLLTAPYLPLLGWQVALLGKQRETGFPAYTLGQMVQMLFSGWTVGIYQGDVAGCGLTGYVAVFVGALALFGGGWLAVLRERWRVVVRLAGWLLLPVVAIWVVSLRGPIFTDRYLIWSAPAFYVLVGAGLAAVWPSRRWGAVLLALPVVALNGFGLYQQAARPLKPQFEPAVRYIESHRVPNDLVLFQIPYNHFVAFYYAGEPLEPWAEAPFTNWRAPDGGYKVGAAYVDGEMAALVAGYDDVWLVYSEVALWDERELVKAWLDGHGTLADWHSFVGVDVYQYTVDKSK